MGNGAGLTNVVAASSASAVNADTVDGLHAGSFATLGTNTFVGNQSVTGNLSLSGAINSNGLRIEPTAGALNVIAGDSQNWVGAGVAGATIAGGGPRVDPSGLHVVPNRVTHNAGTVGGGANNQAGDDAGMPDESACCATVGGGLANKASGGASTIAGGYNNVAAGQTWTAATIGGGQDNKAGGDAGAGGGWADTVAGGGSNTAKGGAATVGGGSGNTASQWGDTVGGGTNNTASGGTSTVGGGDGNLANVWGATVPGGSKNTAGFMAFAAGYRAKAINGGSFVWGDYTEADVTDAGPNSFVVRASGGAFFTNNLTAGAFFGDGSGLTGIPTQSSLDAETAARVNADVALDGTKVSKAGDTMTGTLSVPSLSGGTGTFSGSTEGPILSLDQSGTGPALNIEGANYVLVNIENYADGGSGVWGRANGIGGWGVAGFSYATTGTGVGAFGDSSSPDGSGVVGQGSATTGGAFGVRGYSASTTGTGVVGHVEVTTGDNTGVRGIVHSPQGTAGVFENIGGGKILSGRTTEFDEKFSVSGSGDLVASGGLVLDTDTLVVDATNDRVGIGVASPSDTLEVRVGGTTLADGWTVRSSRRWKTNIQTLQGALEKVARLRGVSYDANADGQHNIGLIAEEVGEVVPEVVAYEANGQDARSVDYARLTALLIEAVKEQQTEIRELKAHVERLTAEVAVRAEIAQKRVASR